jgi:hypothetical protein
VPRAYVSNCLTVSAPRRVRCSTKSIKARFSSGLISVLITVNPLKMGLKMVLKIMGFAAGQRADAFQALGPQLLRLQVLRAGDIRVHA